MRSSGSRSRSSRPCKVLAIGGGTTMLTHCDFVYAGESAKFKLPFIDLGAGAGIRFELFDAGACRPSPGGGNVPAGEPFTAVRAAELGLVTRVVPDRDLLATATATAQKLAAKPAGALRATKRLLKQASIGQLRAAVKVESREFSERLRSAEAKEAFTAFLREASAQFRQPAQSPIAAE